MNLQSIKSERNPGNLELDYSFLDFSVSKLILNSFSCLLAFLIVKLRVLAFWFPS